MDPIAQDKKVGSGRPRQGTLINDRYELTEVIGAGGFATVFRAMDNFIEREVAVKILNLAVLSLPDDALQTVLKRFHREAKLAARIRHPGVVQIFDFGVTPEAKEPYMVMELLEGHDLDDELKKNGRMVSTKALPLFVDCLEALGEAHDLGIIHKDLKPSNLFLSRDGKRRETLRLVDFGIAHIGEAQGSRLTQTGYMLGTPQYMAPEYLHDQSVSPALDVYQMGLILVELLAGQAVVDNQNPWTCALMHVSRDLSVPASLMESPLGPVIDRALALDPAMRFPDAGAFAEALATIDPETVPAVTSNTEFRNLSDGQSRDLAPSSQTGVPLPLETGQNSNIEQQKISQIFTQTLLQYNASSGAIKGAQPLKARAPDHPTGSLHARVTAKLEESTDASMEESELAPVPRKKRPLFIGLVVLALFGGVVLYFLGTALLGNETQDPEGDLRAHARVEIPLIEEPIDPSWAALAHEPNLVAEVPEPPPQELVTEIRIKTLPSGAAIWFGDEELGESPVVFRPAAADGDRLTFTARHDGYEEGTTTLGRDESDEVTIHLEALPKPAPTVIRTPRPQPKVERPVSPPPKTPKKKEQLPSMQLAP